MRFSIVVPSEDLDNVELISGADQGFPSFRIAVLVGKEDELKECHLSEKAHDRRNDNIRSY